MRRQCEEWKWAESRCFSELGVVGSQLPSLQATVLPIAQGDTLFFATDGVRSDFSATLSSRENPQRSADRILEQSIAAEMMMRSS